MAEFATFSHILIALLAHRATLAALLGAHAIFDYLDNLDKYVVRSFAFLVSNCAMLATDHSPTNPNTGIDASLLTDIRRMDRALGSKCLAQLQKDLLKIDSLNGAITTSKVNLLGKNLHRTIDVDDGEKPPPAAPITQNNPSGGANDRCGRDNRVPEIRCVKCSRNYCKSRCDPGNQLKPTPENQARLILRNYAVTVGCLVIPDGIAQNLKNEEKYSGSSGTSSSHSFLL